MEDTDWMDWAAYVWVNGSREQRELLLKANGLDHLLPLVAKAPRKDGPEAGDES